MDESFGSGSFSLRNMTIQKPDCNLSAKNIDSQIEKYIRLIEDMGSSIRDMRGLRLFEALKRDKVNTGPYPHVSLFEAANRIMTDLVILYGVRWLLTNRAFPFTSYMVEFGHDNKNGFDVRSEENGRTLVGEAFNVAPSFFQGKKSSMLKKLRENRGGAEFTILIFIHPAIAKTSKPKTLNENHTRFLLFVNY